MILMGSCLFLEIPASRASQVIGGQIVNGTADGTVPAEMVVTAAGIDSNGNELGRFEVASRPDGSFSIEVPDGAARVVIATDYLGVTYSTVTELGQSVQLTIFETTRDDSMVTITSDTITVVSAGEDLMEVLQLMRIQNSADRTFIGTEEDGVLRLPTAPAAFDLSPGQGITPSRIGQIPGGFITGDPLLPGTTSTNYLYRVRVGRSGWPLQRQVFYPTDHIDVLVGPTLEIAGPGLEFEESVELGGRRYRRYRAGSLSPGAIFEASISFSGNSASGGLVAGAVAGLVILIGAALWLPRLRKRRASPPEPDRQTLIVEIATLDEEFASGTLEEQDYQAHRSELKRKLDELASKR